jgi:hypothetical protein
MKTSPVLFEAVGLFARGYRHSLLFISCSRTVLAAFGSQEEQGSKPPTEDAGPRDGK